MKIRYDNETKIWKSLDYKHGDVVRHFIGQVFLENVGKVQADKVIEWHYDTSQGRTMEEIYREAITVAMNLQKMGVKKADVVVFYCMMNSKVSSLAMGALMLGATVNFYETNFPEESAKYTLKLLNPTVILYEERFKSFLFKILKDIHLPRLQHKLTIDGLEANCIDKQLLKSISSFALDSFRLPKLGEPEKLAAFLLFTSGSTGLPKAVALSHAQILHGMLAFWSQPNGSSLLTSEATIFSLSPIRWISQVLLMLQSLLMGIKRVYASGLPSGEYGRDIVKTGEVTHFFSTPSVFKELILAIKPNDKEALKSVKAIYLGGEDPGQTIIDMAKKLAPLCNIMRCYGMTELAGITSCDRLINGGYIVPGVELKLLNDDLKPVGPNVNGQLCFRLPMAFLGYHAIDNSQTYYKDGFMNTGDYGYVDDNHALHVLARYKDLVRTSQITLIPSRIEKLVCTIPRIFAATLVGYRTTQHCSEDKGALFVVKQLQNVGECMQGNVEEHKKQQTNEALRIEVKKLLENHLKANESHIIRLVNIIDKLPLTSCGKVDKPALIQLAKSLDME